MQLTRSAFISFIVVAAALSAAGQTAPSGPFRVGAAKVDITPTADEMPKQYLGVLDKMYSRTIVIDNGHTSAALISLDIVLFSDQLWKDASERIEKELGIPAVNVMMTATNSHSAPTPTGPRLPTPGAAEQAPPSAAQRRLEDNIVLSVKMAKNKLQPARISYGTGVSYLNVQRDMIDPATHRWWEGPNYDGLSDKTVAVITFESLSGEPIAVYYNYAVVTVIAGMLDLVSSDVPGAASRYIENALDGKVVALWSEGASGDQDPIYFQQTYDLRALRIKQYASRGQDISNSMPAGGQGLDRADPEVARLMNEQKEMITSMGQMMGEEVLHVMHESKRSESDGRIFGKEETISCLGRERTNGGRAGFAGTYKDGPPVEIRLGLLMIDDIAIGSVDALVYNEIGQRLKKESPYAKTMMATITNGLASSLYIPDDASFGRESFEVLSARIQPGCAETAIVDGIIGMMPRIEY